VVAPLAAQVRRSAVVFEGLLGDIDAESRKFLENGGRESAEPDVTEAIVSVVLTLRVRFRRFRHAERDVYTLTREEVADEVLVS
jgi:hypothetical protein